MNVPQPLNAHEHYLYAINMKLDMLIELIGLLQKQEEPKPARKRTTKRTTDTNQ